MRQIAAAQTDPLPAELGLTIFRGEVAAGRLWEAARIWEVTTTETDGEALIKDAYGAFLDLLQLDDPVRAMARIARLEAGPDDAEFDWIAYRVRSASGGMGIVEMPPAEQLLDIAKALVVAGKAVFADDARAMWHDRMKDVDAWRRWIVLAEAAGDHHQIAARNMGLARLLYSERAEIAQVKEALTAAEISYDQISHGTGKIKVAEIRTEMAIQRDGESPDRLDPIIDAYLAAGCPRDALSALLTASSIAHERANLPLAKAYSDRLQALADACDMALVARQAAFRLADMALREGYYARARDLCDEALAEDMPTLAQAGLRALKATSLSSAGDNEGAAQELSRAVEMYVDKGFESSASDLISVWASAMVGADPSQASYDLASALMDDWAAKDVARGDHKAAATKHIERGAILLAQGILPRSRQPGALEAIMAAGEAALQQGEELLSQIKERDSFDLHANLAQIRSQLGMMRNDPDASVSALVHAQELYTKANMPFHAANSSFLIGCHFLNAANAPDGDKGRNFGKAENHLISAFNFYRDVGGMTMQAVNAAHKLAMLYLNMFPFVRDDIQGQCAAFAEELLDWAVAAIDDLRRAYSAPTRLASLEGKLTQTDLQAKLLTEAVRLHVGSVPNYSKAWQWMAASKARSLNDLVATDAFVSAELQTAIAEKPGVMRLIELERAQIEERLKSPVAARMAWEERISKTRQELRALYPPISDYLDAREGRVAPAAELEATFAGHEHAAFIDWTICGDRIFLSVARPGQAVTIERLPLTMSEVTRFLRFDYSASGRRTLLRDEWFLLSQLDHLVTPLSWLTQPGESLIFCPSGLLRTLPLHALEIDGAPVIARNPVSWSPSVSLLRHTRRHERTPASGRATVFGQAELDRADTRTFSLAVAESLGTTPYLRGEVRADRLKHALETSQIVHFNGHAVFNEREPLHSHLKLAAGGTFRARDAFDLRQVAARLVTLGACESAASRLMPGDEPFGMVAALLQAGVQSVIGALWKVQDRATGRIMAQFYRAITDPDHPLAPDVALQQAVNTLRQDPEFNAPYYWAGVILNGNPWTEFSTTLKE
ncbi:MAG: CHAT domain-containing protein [Pseudomonadota bacterium]